MSKSEQADIKDVGGFVGGYLKEGKRRAGQVMNRSMLTLDIDYAAQDMTDILSMFYDFAYCLYSTHKHREISPRLRLVIPLKRNVNADEYEAIGRKVADIVGMDYFDDTTYQPHRLMYWPSTSNDAEFFFIVWFGLTWSLELYQQANARLYRQGQNHTTIIHHIMTDNTIDQRVYKALQNKELTQEELMKAIKARIAKHK